MPNAADLLPYLTLVMFAVAGFFYLRSTVAKQTHDEWEELAKTRGHKIEDLHDEVEALRREVARIKGQMEALQALKVNELARAVVEKLRDEGVV